MEKKCAVENCIFFCGGNNCKCSYHRLDSSKITTINKIVGDYLKENESKILQPSLENKMLILLSQIKKDDSNELHKVFSEFLLVLNKKYILAETAYNILKLLSNNIEYSHHLVHCVYPYVIDCWNIDKSHDWPAVCYYYDDFRIKFGSIKKYLNTEVIKSKFEIPKIKFVKFKKNLDASYEI